MVSSRPESSAKSARRRADDTADYAVEQLEPKILLSAAPIDAPAEAYGASPLASVDSSALEEVRFTDVVEAEMSSEFFSEEEHEEAVFGAGEDFDWGDEDEAIVIESDERLSGSGETEKDLVIDGVFAPGNSPGLVEVDDFENNGVLEIELAGTAPEDFDRVIANGTAKLGGTLKVSLIDGFEPTLGDEFQFLTFASREGDFDTIEGIKLSETLALVPFATDSGYVLKAVGIGAQAIAELANEAQLVIDAGSEALNDLIEDAITARQSLELFSVTDFFGSITLGSTQLNGQFDVAVDNDQVIFALSDGTLIADANSAGADFEAGLRVIDANGVFVFNPVDQGFVLSASGDVHVYGSDIELGGTVSVSWNTTGQELINEVYSAGSSSFTVNAADGAASLSGQNISLETEVADLVFDFSIGLSTTGQSGLNITINDGSLIFSDSPRTNVAVTEVDGELDISVDGDITVTLAGTLNADLVGFDITNASVDVSYESVDGDRQFRVNTPDRVDIAVQSNAGEAKVSFVAEALTNGGVEFIFAFEELSLVTSDASLVDASGVLFGNVDGVAGELYGTATVQAGSTFAAGARLQIRFNTTDQEISRTLPLGDGEISINFSGAEASQNFFEVTVISAFFSIGDQIQYRGPVSFTSETLEIDGVDYDVEVIADDGVEFFLGVGSLTPGVWGLDLDASGISIANATVVIIRFTDTGNYTVVVSGDFAAQNLGSVSISGTGRLELNQSGLVMDTVLERDGNPADGTRLFFPSGSSDLEVNFGALDIEIDNQTLSGAAKITTESDSLRVQLSQVQANFAVGTGNLGLRDGAGDVTFGDDAVFGGVTGTIVSTGFDDFSFSGTLTSEFNSGTETQTYTRGGESIGLPSGPFVRLSGYDLTITTQGESITGDFVFENGVIDQTSGIVSSGSGVAGDEEVLLGFATDVRLSTAGLDAGEMTLSGVVVVSQNFFATQLAGSFRYSENEIRIEGDLDLDINTRTTNVIVNSPLSGETLTIAPGPRFDLGATDFLIDLRAATLSGSFTLSTSLIDGQPLLNFEFTGLTINFGGSPDAPLLQLFADSGSFGVLNGGLFGDISGLGVMGGSLDLTGALDLQFNTLPFDFSGISTGDFSLSGPSLDLTLGSLNFSGAIDFGLIKSGLSDFFDGIELPDPPAFEGLEIGFANVDLALPGGLGNVNGVTGGLVLRKSGFAGQLSGAVDIDTSDLAFAGTSTLKINTFNQALFSTLEIAGDNVTLDLPSGPFFSIDFEDTDLELLGASLNGDLSLILSAGLASGGIDELLIAVSDLNIQADLGTGNYELTNLSGILFVDDLGVSASFTGGMALNGIPDVNFGLGAVDLEFSTRAQSLTKVFQNRQYAFRAENYFEIAAAGLEVTLDSNSVSGDFLFHFDPSGGLNIPEMTGGVSNASVSIGSNGEATLNNGSGVFILTDAGLALGFSGELDLTLPDISAVGDFSAEINTTSVAVNRSVTIGAETVTLDLQAGPLVGIAGEGVSLTVADQQIAGDFIIQSRANGDLLIAIDEASTVISDGTTDFLRIDDGVGAIVATSDGAAFDVSGALTVLLPNISASGTFRVLVNSLPAAVNETVTVRDVTRSIQIRAGPVVNVIGINAQLIVGEQALQGGFSFETLDNGGLAIEVISASLFLTANGSTLVNISGANGNLIADTDGTDGILTVGSAVFNVPGINVSSSAIRVELNTRFVAVQRTATLNDESIDLDLPGGPFVRVSALDATVTFSGLSASGSDAELEGDFFFEKSNDELILAASSVTAAVDVNGSGGELTDGEGVFLLSPDGLAGILKGSLALDVPGVSAGAEIFLRINNTGGAVSETITLGADELDLIFSASEGNVFTVVLSEASLAIGDLIFIEGSFSFTNSGDNQVVGATGVDIFIGEGPRTLEDGSENPLARGFHLSNATFALVKYTDAGVESFALQATGTISVIGIDGLTIGGTVTLRYNSFQNSIDETVSTGASNAVVQMGADEAASISGDAFFEIDGMNLALEVAGQAITANANISRYRSNDRQVFRVSLSDGSASFSNGGTDLLTISELDGSLFLFDDGLALQASGDLLFGIASVSASGSYRLEINTTGNAIAETFTAGNVTRSASIPAGPFVRISGIGAELDVLDQTVLGNFLFEQNASGDVIASVSEVEANFGDGALQLTDGEGVISITTAGLAASLRGGISINVPDVAISADLDLKINTRSTAVNETVEINGVEKALQIRAGPTFALEANQIAVEIAGQTLTADLYIEQVVNGLDRSTLISFSNASLSINANGRTLASVTDANGDFELTNAGLAGRLSIIELVFDLPGLFFTVGTAEIQVNTRPTDAIIAGTELPAGPFFRIALLNSSAELGNLNVGGVPARLSGDFFFEQAGEITRIAAANVSAAVQVNRNGATLENGRGALLVTSSGTAGVIEGDLAANLPGVSAGATLVLQFNNSGGPVDETIVLGPDSIEIKYNASQGEFFSVALANFSITIADLITIEGSITFTSSNGREIAAGAGLSVFIGEGPATLEDGSTNPLSRGFLLSDATVGLIKQGDTYAVVATGQVQVIGISNLNLSGLFTVRVNQFADAISQTLPVTGTSETVVMDFNASETVSGTGEAFYEITGDDLVIDAFEQRIMADLALRRITLDRNGLSENAFYFGLSDLSAVFSDGTDDIVSLTNAGGDLLVLSDGIAAQFDGQLDVLVPNVSATGVYSLVLNTTGSEINETFTVGGAPQTLQVEAGPFVRIVGNNVSLTISDQVLTGDFGFEKNADGEVRVQLTDIRAAFSDGATDILVFENGSGVLLLTSAGAAADLAGDLSIELPDVSASGSFRFILNTTPDAVNRTINLTGVEQTLNVEPGTFVQIIGRGVSLNVLGNELSGDFGFQKSADGKVLGQISNGRLAFNNGSRDIVVLENGTGVLVATTAGMAFEFGGDLTVDVPEVSVTGSFSVAANTSTAAINETINLTDTPQTLTLPAGQYVRITGSDVSLVIAGQSLSGNFLFERQNDGTILIAASDVNLSLGDGIVTIENGVGGLLIYDDGIAGGIDGGVSLNVPGLSTSASFGIRINTTVRAISQTTVINGQSISLTLPQGRFLRVEAQNVDIVIAEQTLSGNFFFEQRADMSVRFAASNVAMNIGNGVATVSGGGGDFEINQDGIVGGLSVQTFTFNVPGVTLGTGEVRVELNTRPQEVTDEFNFGTGPETLTLPGGPYVRVALFDTFAELGGITVGGSAARLNGDFFFDQAGGVTRLAMANVGAAVELDGSSANLIDGGGALVITSAGVAGVVQGTVDVALPGIDANTTIFLRINNTGQTVDEVIRFGAREISVVFGVGEETLFQVTLDGLSLNIADVISIEGSFSFVSRGDFQVAAGQNVTIFIGEGPAFLSDGTLNSEARGILIDQATVGIVKQNTAGGTLYAVSATGRIQVVGLPEITLEGSVAVRINQLDQAVNETIVFPGETENVDVVFADAEVATVASPFVDIEAIGVLIEVSDQSISGDIAIGRYKDVNDEDIVRLSLSNGRAAFGSATEEILVLENAEGDILLLTDGVGLAVTGSLRFEVPNVATSADFTLQVNTTAAAINESYTAFGQPRSLTLPAGPYVFIAGNNVAINIADQTLSGNLSFEQQADGTVTVTASQVDLTLTADGTDVVVVDNAAGDFEINSDGIAGALAITSIAVTIPNVTFTVGETYIQLNTRSVEVTREIDLGSGLESITFPAGPFVRVAVLDVSLSLTGLTSSGSPASISGDFFFDQVGDVTRVAATNVTASVDVNGSGGSLIDGEGALVITSAGVAASISGVLQASVPGLDAGGTLILRFNNTGTAVDEEIEIGADRIKVLFADSEGMFFGVALLGASINIGNIVTIEGNISFVNSGGRQVVAGTELTLFIGEGPALLEDGEINPFARGLLINNATLGLVKVDDAGGPLYALEANGDVQVIGIADLVLSGTIRVRVNTFTEAVTETIGIPGTEQSVTVNFDASQTAGISGPYALIEAIGITLEVAGQSLVADLSVNRFRSDRNNTPLNSTDDIEVLRLSLTNVNASFGSLTENFVTLSGGTGDFLVLPEGLAAEVQGTLTFNVPDVSATGDFALRINTTGFAINESYEVFGVAKTLTLPAGPYFQIAGTGVELTIAGQEIGGDFTFEQNADGSVRVYIENAFLDLKSGNEVIVSVTGGFGTFLIDSAGVAGGISVGTFTLNVEGVTFTTDKVTVQINTRATSVTDEFYLGAEGAQTLTLPAGPYVRVEILNASLTIADLPGASLSGNFAFDQAGGVTRLALSNVTAEVTVNGEGARLIDGAGALVITPTGLAGTIEGSLDVALGGLEAGGDLFLRINNTGGAIDQTLTLGTDTFQINFSASEGMVFSVALANASLNIADLVLIQGSFSFTNRGNFSVAGGTDLLIFIGEGIPQLADGSFNPNARGLLITDATIGLIKVDTPTGSLYALDATGTVGVLGIAGLDLSGEISVRLNTITGDILPSINESISIPGLDSQINVEFSGADVPNLGDGLFFDIAAPNISFEVSGLSIQADLNFSRPRIDLGGGVTELALGISLSNVSTSIGDGLIMLDGGFGDILVLSSGIAANIGGTVGVNVPGLALGGGFELQINTSGIDLDVDFDVQGSLREINVRAGPFVQLSGTGVSLDIAGQTLSGNFDFTQLADGSILAAFSDVSLSLGPPA
ncbi:LEPR-XLL domain-containing protein, partial [Akkermansiaceae bacterium]|nr:LEPR-XLL domain-containing protein [Akkermansiaceae bacterium]